MSSLNKKEIVLKLIEEHKITAYEIGNNTPVSALAVQNIIDGTTKNPRDKTLIPIIEYIENKIVGSAIPGHKNHNPQVVNDPEVGYNAQEKVNEIYSELKLQSLAISCLDNWERLKSKVPAFNSQLRLERAQAMQVITFDIVELITREDFKGLTKEVIKKKLLEILK